MLTDKLHLRSLERIVKRGGPAGAAVLKKLAYNDYCLTAAQSEDAVSQLMQIQNPLTELRPMISDAEISQIISANGPWPKFFRAFLLEELRMEAEKVQRMDYNFGGNALVLANKGSLSARPNLKFYETLDRSLPKHAALVTEQETDGLAIEALRAYISRGLGFDLKGYATNLRRVPTFREGAFQRLFLGKSLTDLPELARPDFCDQLKSTVK